MRSKHTVDDTMRAILRALAEQTFESVDDIAGSLREYDRRIVTRGFEELVAMGLAEGLEHLGGIAEPALTTKAIRLIEAGRDPLSSKAAATTTHVVQHISNSTIAGSVAAGTNIVQRASGRLADAEALSRRGTSPNKDKVSMVTRKLRVAVFYGGEAATLPRAELLAWLRGPQGDVEALIASEMVPSSDRSVDLRVDDLIAWADCAIAIVTSDDRSTHGAPNVLDEMGRWTGAKVRATLCRVLQKGVEVPSNHDGIVRLEFEKRIGDKFAPLLSFLQEVRTRVIAPVSTPAVVPTSSVDHDRRIFKSIDRKMSEKSLNVLLTELDNEHSYRDKQLAPVEAFVGVTELTSNEFIIDEIKGRASELRDSILELTRFCDHEFDMFPTNQQGPNLRYCLHPKLNPDRAAFVTNEDVRQYDQYVARMNAICDAVRSAYRDFRQAVKILLVV